MSDTLGPQDPSQTGGSPVAAPAADTPAAPAPQPSQPAQPQKPSLWRAVVTGALNGLAGSGGATSFGGGLGRGAAGELNAQEQARQQPAQDQAAADAHTLAQARVASTYADIAHTQQLIHNMPPNWQSQQSEKLADQTAEMLGKGLLVPQGPAAPDWHTAQTQATALMQKNPSRLYMVMPVRGEGGKLTFQAMESPNSPTQSDVDVSLPDGTQRTIPAGSMSARDVMGLQVASIKQDIANQASKKTQTGPMKVVPDAKSKTGYSYAAIGNDGKLSDIKGEAPAPSAQTFANTKTTTILGDDGRPQVFAFNPQTNQFDRPQGISASGHMGTVSEQAAAINDAGDSLVKVINANRDKWGTFTTWVKKNGLNTPVADPTLAGMQTAMSTFAALQPALHSFRSQEAMKHFEKIIGGIQNNPDAAIASIRAIQGTAKSINPKLKLSFGTVKLKAPDGTVKDFDSDTARYYISRGAKVVK